MIHVEHLEKSFGSIRAVADISFQIARGEVVGLLGPNGAGKTTTMRIITGFLAADRGYVEIAGQRVEPGRLETRRKVGYLPENAPLYTDLEVTAYLTYMATLRGIPKTELQRRLRRMIEVTGLGDVVGRLIGQLSKGYRQRVGLAAVMIHEPPILILDEPTSGLDPNQIVEIRNLIRELGRERTVILSTHILQEVEATCSRAIIINRGKIVGQGTIEALMQRGTAGDLHSVSIRGERDRVQAAIQKLDGVTGIQITELKRETASLEAAFREMTQ